MLRFLLVLTVASTLGLQGWSILFNNFAVEVLRLDGGEVGVIQSLRVLPLVGGALWMIDYRIPFIAGAVLGCVGLVVVQRIRVPDTEPPVVVHPVLAGAEFD